ncbi:hypothetical protein D9758_019116 [Tetrapyrgos nigripes]|uniref:Uncharacterized protein n=1 Tax=Tetrapyrgos nigripes TaxID=182062 RepID=A0A8H5AZN0_9AGAR|nr:hypothetical protein D9758_019116 [Tetrapyrgos nigripes]
MTTYQLDHTLRGHTGTIQCMQATEDGKYLASGSGNGTLIWDMDKMSIVKHVSSNEIRDAMTAILWVKRQDTLEEGLIYGTGTVQGLTWMGKVLILIAAVIAVVQNYRSSNIRELFTMGKGLQVENDLELQPVNTTSAASHKVNDSPVMPSSTTYTMTAQTTAGKTTFTAATQMVTSPTEVNGALMGTESAEKK